MDVAAFLVALIAVFAAAKLFGEIAERLGQPAVLGELLAGIVVGVSGLQLVDPHEPTMHLLAELGVIFLLFMIGLETDLKRLLSVGTSSTAVAVVGVALPFFLGYEAGILFGYSNTVSIFLGASLTATSVGIASRVLSDLGHLRDDEAQVVLGAAVIDDVIGLVILAAVAAMAHGEAMGGWEIARITTMAFGFVAAAVVGGGVLAPWLIRIIARLRVAKAIFFASIMFAFALAWVAEAIGSAMIVGSFAAGLVLARTDRGEQIQREVHDIAHFFVPIFFVSVGAAIDLRSLNPMDPAARPHLLFGGVLTLVAVLGKFVAGWAALRRGLRRHIIGIGMIPRGEVGLIFARIGLSAGILSAGLYSSVALMVVMTTFITPPLLRIFLPRRPPQEISELSRIVTNAPGD